jgi:hypothetical protein
VVKTYNCLYSISIITVAINLYCANVLNVDSAKISRRLTEAPVRQDTTKEQSHANTPTTISIPRRRSREFLTQNPPWYNSRARSSCRFHYILQYFECFRTLASYKSNKRTHFKAKLVAKGQYFNKICC